MDYCIALRQYDVRDVLNRWGRMIENDEQINKSIQERLANVLSDLKRLTAMLVVHDVIIKNQIKITTDF